MTPIVTWMRRHDRVLLGGASVAGVLMVWEILVLVGFANSRLVGSPSAVVHAGIQEVQTAGFWTNAQVSAFEFTVGYLAAVLIGVPLGIMLGWYRRLSYVLEPIIGFLYATPRIALLPLIVLAVGINVWSKVIIVFLGAWITITLITYLGVRTVDARLLDVARLFGARDRQVFQSVVLPGSVPFVLAGLRLGVGRAVIGVVVGELYASNAGLGFMIKQASNQLQSDRMLFGTFVLILLSFAAVASLRRLELRYLGWRTGEYLAR